MAKDRKKSLIGPVHLQIVDEWYAAAAMELAAEQKQKGLPEDLLLLTEQESSAILAIAPKLGNPEERRKILENQSLSFR